MKRVKPPQLDIEPNIALAHATLQDKVKIVMPLEHKWYGVTEFAFEDPDGYLITFAERNEPA